MLKNSLILNILTFFTSFSTLFCCAIPIILVFFGLGAVSSSLISNFPFITIFSENSSILFITSLLLLIFSAYLIFFRSSSCPNNKKYAKICQFTQKTNKIVWLISTIIFLIAVFFKYVLILLI